MMVYKKTQYGIFISVLTILISIGLIYAYWFQLGSKPIPFSVLLVILPIFLTVLLFFYKLTINIDHDKITAKFGIGIIKKEMSLSEIDLTTIEKIKLPWYTGIGIRITSLGTLYNVKVGSSILIKNKQKTNTFLVGTDDFENIKKILIKHKKR